MSMLPSVLILTPIKSAARYIETYIEGIEKLTFPMSRLSIGLLEGDSEDNTWQILQRSRNRLDQRCQRVTLLKRDFNFRMPHGIPRWTPIYQLARRATLARARNHLLFGALRDEDYVLWLDVDVVAFPCDMVETLIATGLNIVQPHCVRIAGGPTFDLNGWSHFGERHLDHYRGHGKPVRLDSVGGTVLFIKADIHRDGLVFPPFRYGLESPVARPRHPIWGRGEIETEGLAMMAADMGLQCWGLPDYEVIHDDN